MHDLTRRFLAGIFERSVFHPVCLSFDHNNFPITKFEEAETFLNSLNTFNIQGSEQTHLYQIAKSALFLENSFEHYVSTLSRPDSPFRGIFSYEAHIQALSKLIADPDFGNIAKQLLSAFYNLHGIVLYNQNKFDEAKRKFEAGVAYVESKSEGHAVLDFNLDLVKIRLNQRPQTLTPAFHKSMCKPPITAVSLTLSDNVSNKTQPLF